MLVEVYWNIRRKLFSIRALEGSNKGRVIDHDTHVELKDATFHVSEAGRQRVLREKRKNVHAMVRGTWMGPYTRPPGMGCPVNVTYNPYRDEVFNHKGRPVEKAAWVEMFRSGAAPEFSSIKGVIAAFGVRS